MMRFVTLGAVIAVAVAGCAPTSYSGFAKNGVNYETVSRDDTACRVEANQLFPSALFTSTIHGGYGGWGGYGGPWLGGSVHVQDVNSGMRAEHRVDCMANKGYRPVVHPICTDQQLAGRNFAPINGAPLPSPSICAVRGSNGSALVDLSKPI